MENGVWGLLEDWGGEGALVRYDRPTGGWIFVALHDLTLGPGVGGCRMKRYPRPEDGLLDALRLAEGMTYKWAAIDFPFGGAKSVLAVPGPLTGEDREGLLRRFGRLLQGLRGTYSTGVDLGTDPEDMAVVAEESDYVMGIVEGRSVDPGPYTALGVYEGVRAVLAHAFGDESPDGRRVLIQGVGDVGLPLARLLAADGAHLLLADLDTERAARVAGELGGTAVEPHLALETECDVLAPCAVGGILDATSIPRLPCRAVAGSANNQLWEPADAERLRERGILYAPDYIVNAGGAIAFGRMHLGTRDEAELEAAVRTIGDALRAIFEEADAAGEPPTLAAQRRAEETLRRARGEDAAAPVA